MASLANGINTRNRGILFSLGHLLLSDSAALLAGLGGCDKG